MGCEVDPDGPVAAAATTGGGLDHVDASAGTIDGAVELAGGTIKETFGSIGVGVNGASYFSKSQINYSEISKNMINIK
jgi:hypothetical protein